MTIDKQNSGNGENWEIAFDTSKIPHPKEENLVQPVDKYEELRKEFIKEFENDWKAGDHDFNGELDWLFSKIKHLEEESYRKGLEDAVKEIQLYCIPGKKLPEEIQESNVLLCEISEEILKLSKQ